MDRAELLEALEDIQGRLDVAQDGLLTEADYDQLTDAVDMFKYLLGRRAL